MNQWHAFECKGRVSGPNSEDKKKAKAQANRLVSVNGTRCTLHVGAFTFFDDDVLNFYWRDPPPDNVPGIEIKVEPKQWRFHYQPIIEALESRSSIAPKDGQFEVMLLEEADVKAGIHPLIAHHLLDRQWGAAQRTALENEAQLVEEGYRPDGLKILAGDSWHRPAESNESEDG